MKAQKIIRILSDVELDFAEATLLTEEEYCANRERIASLAGWWWLRSPGLHQRNAAYVSIVGSLGTSRVNIGRGCVRPALKIRNLKSSDLQISDQFVLAGHTWTVIAEDIALCDDSIGRSAFREDWRAANANDYERSDVKKSVEKWAMENGVKCDG